MLYRCFYAIFMYRNNPITAVLYSKKMCSCAMFASHCVLAYIICVCTCAVYSYQLQPFLPVLTEQPQCNRKGSIKTLAICNLRVFIM